MYSWLPRDDPLKVRVTFDALHGESLSRASLPVGEDGPVEAVKYGINEGTESLLVKIGLPGVPVVDSVKGEGLRGVRHLWLGVPDLDDALLGRHGHDLLMALLRFLLV